MSQQNYNNYLQQKHLQNQINHGLHHQAQKFQHGTHNPNPILQAFGIGAVIGGIFGMPGSIIGGGIGIGVFILLKD